MTKEELEAFEKEISRKFKEPIIISCLAPQVSDLIVSGTGGDKQKVSFERKLMKLECMRDFAQLQSSIREGRLIPYPDGWMQVFTFLLSLLDFYEEDEPDVGDK